MPTKTEKTKVEKVKNPHAKETTVKETGTSKTPIIKTNALSSKATMATPAPAIVSAAKGTATKIEKIKADFASLTPGEQRILLTEWSQNIKATENPITSLVELVQKTFGANLTTEIWTEGASHVPVVYCKLIMPDGTEYTASGKNQKIAKLLAAEEALADLQKI